MITSRPARPGGDLPVRETRGRARRPASLTRSASPTFDRPTTHYDIAPVRDTVRTSPRGKAHSRSQLPAANLQVCAIIQLVYSKFSVANFRAFDDLAVQLSPVTVVSGRNNAGKTALLEAIFLHSSGPVAGTVALTVLQNARGQGPIALNTYESGTVWDSLFHNYNTSSTVKLNGVVNRETVSVELSTIEGSTAAGLAGQSVGAGGQAFSQAIHIRFRRGRSGAEQYTQTATQQTLGQQITGLINVQLGGISLQVQPPAQPFIPAYYLSGRTRASQAELATRYSALRVRGRDQDLLRAIQEIEPRLKALEVLVINGQPLLHADVGGPDLLPFPLFGEGMVAAADFISAIYQTKGGIILIDEVENGIHYTVLENVWWQIKRAAQRTNTQVIASTHSRECLQAARSAFQKEPRMLGLVRLWRDQKDAGRISATKYNADELGDALELNLDIR